MNVAFHDNLIYSQVHTLNLEETRGTMCVIASAYTMIGEYLVDNQQYLSRVERRTYSRHADRHSP